MTAIRLSCSDYSWPHLRHETVMAVIADLGFTGVDVGVFNTQTHVTVPAIVADPDRTAEHVLRISDQAGLQVADVFLTSHTTLERLSPTSSIDGDWEELRAIFSALVKFSSNVGAAGITMLPGVVESGVMHEATLALSAERLSVLVEFAAAAGLAVSVEPHVGSCIEDPDSTMQLLEMCPGLSITLDPSHFGYLGWSVSSLIQLIPRTRHVQIRPAGRGVMQTRLANNELDLTLLVSELRKHNYPGWIASEFVWMEKWGCDRVDNTSESFLLGRYLQELTGSPTNGG